VKQGAEDLALEFAGMVSVGGHCDVQVLCPYEIFVGTEIVPQGELSGLKLGRLRIDGQEQLLTADSLASAVPLEMFARCPTALQLDMLGRGAVAMVRIYNVSSVTRGFLLQLRGRGQKVVLPAPPARPNPLRLVKSS
jgi:hypothetical protein